MGPAYIPILKGKPGEFGALRTLRFSIRSQIVPLIEITPPPTRTAKDAPVKQTTVERRMKEQVSAIKRAWPVVGLPLFIGAQHLLSSAAIGLTSLFKQLALAETEDENVTAIPVTGPERSVEYQASVCNVIKTQRSFLANLSDLKSRINTVPRSEWNLWSTVSKLEAVSRIPTFADYAIQHPTVPPSGFKGTANIRYTAERNWLVFKGSVLDERDPRASGVTQFKTLAREVSQHPAYCDRDFSAGDEYIHDCATWDTPSGQPMKWREVGTNHHITYVVNQLASAPGSSMQA